MQRTKNSRKRLSLRPETVRQLTQSELELAQGGQAGAENKVTQTTCCPQ